MTIGFTDPMVSGRSLKYTVFFAEIHEVVLAYAANKNSRLRPQKPRLVNIPIAI